MSKRKIIFISCGTITLVGMLLFGLLVAWVIHVSVDVEGASISIDSPLDVKVGETFKMLVNVQNNRDQRDLTVSDIDISDTYLAGFVIISTEPDVKESMHVPIDNSLSHTFDTSVAAGGTATFTFTMRAEKAGIFRGDVDVCEGSRFITKTAQTVVKE